MPWCYNIMALHDITYGDSLIGGISVDGISYDGMFMAAIEVV